MQISSVSFLFGAALIIALSGPAALAQDQPAAGSPPPGQSSEAPAAQAPDPQAAAPMQSSPESTPMESEATPGNRTPPDPQKMTRMLAKRLALTPGQQSEIEPIIASRQQQMQSVRADSTLSQRDRRAKAMAILHDAERRIESVLSPAQKQQYAQLKQEMREKRQQRGPAPAPTNQ